ncbi:MAG: mRNA surveillance protein pelota [Candidatus Njordarchaeales archaeon]
MRILEIDKKQGLIKILVENTDDLYVLFSFIRPGDIAVARTSRRIKIREGVSVRKPMVLKIEIQDVGFHEFAEMLRLKGRILEGPERFVSIGSYHTINVKAGDSITIIRPEGLSDIDLQPLREAEELTKFSPILLIAIEEEEATIGVLTSYGLKVLTSVRGVFADKSDKEYESRLRKFFSDVLSVVSEAINQYEPQAIIIGGPGFTKEHFADFVKERLNRKIPILIDSVTSGTEAGLYELIRRGTPQKVLAEQRVAEETAKIEELLMHIGKNDRLAVYGYEEVKEALEMGAVETLMISMSLINTTDLNLRKRILELVKLAKATRSRILFVSTMHPAGKQFARLGGIAAILRYPIKTLNHY